jgi:hypothetical protein
MRRKLAEAVTAMDVRAARVWAIGLVMSLAACRTQPLEPAQRSPVVDATAKIAQAAAAVTGQTAKFANNYEKGKFVGFDTHTYPGTATMTAWKKTPGSPYKWVGYYLPAPCHNDKSWSGKRDTLIAMGWGLALVYVGQQTWGKTPRNLTSAQRAALRKQNDCATDLISEEEGILNADEAVRTATAEGFPQGAVIFLDIERMEKIPEAMRTYYRAWTARVLASGKFKPGIYTHQHNAEQIFNDVKGVFVAARDTATPRFWIAGGKGFHEGRAPQDVGFAFAGMWQGVIDVARSVANVRRPVDVNVSAWASPSESGTAPIPGE